MESTRKYDSVKFEVGGKSMILKLIPDLGGTRTSIETGFCFATKVGFHLKYPVNLFCFCKLAKEVMRVADVWLVT